MHYDNSNSKDWFDVPDVVTIYKCYSINIQFTIRLIEKQIIEVNKD